MIDGEDYYSPHPRVRLEQPLALAGQLGAGVSASARAMAASSGLPFVDLELLVEARIGSTRAKLAYEQGFAALREAEESALRRALRDQPHPLISVEGAMPAGGAALDTLLEQARVVYVQRPDEELLARIQAGRARAPARYPEFIVAAPERVEDLAPYLARRAGALARAHAVFDATGLHPQRVADLLLDSIERLR